MKCSVVRRPGIRSAQRRMSYACERLEVRRMLCALHDGIDDLSLGTFPSPITPPATTVDPAPTVITPHATHPLSSLPLLSSRSSATAKIFLDFDGDVVANWGTNNSVTPAQPYHPGTIPAYDS